MRKNQDEKENPQGRGRMTVVTCSNCGRQGHKYPTCSLPLKAELAIRKNKHRSNRVEPQDPSRAAAPSNAPGSTPASPRTRSATRHVAAAPANAPTSTPASPRTRSVTRHAAASASR
ncbi:hypothetical protein BRADI_1g63006v3 [Brachypodium distachyon]|uniref:CCHC-type domain-containing protein n=1 Tax=Brachypodium distachyon TaxID=15368 RepID=A0A0Q3HH01_BRADI|nr:hypothetical protein BRADI_1g63006v3 [Brachypodium distachyon]